MPHRHRHHQRFTLATSDDVVSCGRWQDRPDLHRAALRDEWLLNRIRHLCRRVADPRTPHHQIWLHHVEARRPAPWMGPRAVQRGVLAGARDEGGHLRVDEARTACRLRTKMTSVNGYRHPTAGCLFSGMGGFASGLIRAGFSVRWASDNDEFACAAFHHRLPEIPFVEKDARNLSAKSDRLSEVDVLAAGFPCQSFSQAGSRQGFDDDRGKLFFEIPRIISEFEPEARPRLIVLENVPNLLYGAERSWFDQVRRALRRAGYWFREESCWTVNVKDATELPQDRERLFMVAASREHFPYNPFNPPSDSNGSKKDRRSLDEFIDRSRRADEDAYLPQDNRYYKMIDREMTRGESPKNIYQLRRSYVREKKQGFCPTLTANMGIGGHNVPFIRDPWGIRRLSVAEVARLQGFESQEQLFPNMPTAEQYRLLGNAVCVHLAHRVGNICAGIISKALHDD